MSEDAWTAIADGEQAAVYGYGVLTAQLSGTMKQAGLDAIDAHRIARDKARVVLAEQQLNPSSPVVFDLPFPVKDTKSAAELAVLIELRLADLYLALVAETEGADRRRASESAQASTVSATRWGWVPTAFPTGAPGDPNSGSTEAPSSDPSATGDAGSFDSGSDALDSGLETGSDALESGVDSGAADPTVSPNDGATVE